MKNKFLLLVSLLCFSCGGAISSQGTTITDLIGREIIINPGIYKRVCCIGAGALRMYSYIGDINNLSGVEDIDNPSLTNRPKMFDTVARPYFIAYEDVFKTLPSCGVGGPNAQTIETEKILSCNPDIIISEYEDVNNANALQNKIGVPVITIRYGDKGIFDENVSKSLTLLGKIFAKEDRATELNNFIIDEKQQIISKINNATSDKKVYICGLGNWGTTNHLMTVKNYEPFNICKINNIANDLIKNGIQKIEEEKFISYSENIDIMIIDAAAIKNIKPLYKQNPNMFSTCKAWNNGEVYLQMAYNAYYTNLETSLINTWFNAKVVYQDLFSDLDMNEKTNQITKKFLNKELANEINAYPNSFGGYQKINTATFFDN